MNLNNKLISEGRSLFRFRSYLPLFLIPLLLYSISNNINFIEEYNYLFIFSLLISILGQFIRSFTVAFISYGTSGRNTKGQYASSLNTTGIYSVVRHPLYLGNFFMYLGPFIFSADIFVISIYSLLFYLYYERIMLAEEDFLIDKFGTNYIKWANITPAFVPSFKNYIENNEKFSFKKILHREYAGINGLIFLFIFIYLYKSYLLKIEPLITTSIMSLIIINILLYIILRYYKKIYKND